MFSKRNCGWTKVQQEYEKEGGKLTSGTTKLTAIAPQGRRSKTWGLLEEVIAGVLGVLEQVPPPGKQSLGCRMTRWRRSTREGSIYRTKRVRANLTYLFAASVKSEGTQVDMVNVRTVIKGLRR